MPSFKGKKRLGKILFRQALFQKKDLVIPSKNGLRFHLLNTHDSVGRDLFFDGEYEPKTIRAIEQYLSSGDVFIDAGANIGAISLPVAKRNKVNVFSFEPAPHIFQILKKNKEINAIDNITLMPMGLSDKAGTTDFYESDRMHGWSGMVKIDSFQHYKVNTTTLDLFAAEQGIERIAVLKADVQGWEYHVFKGAAQLLNEKRIGTIVFEFERWAEKNAGLEPGTAQQFLMDKGYVIRTLDGGKLDKPLTEGSVNLVAVACTTGR